MIHSNTTLNEEEGEWINQCSARLRLIQSDACATSAEKRREYLKEELGRCLENVPPANHGRFLEALLTRHPVAGQVLRTTVPQPTPLPAKPTAESVEQIVERLLEKVTGLPDEKRAEISKRLSEAGLIWVDRDAIILETSDDLRKKLGLKAEQQPSLTKIVELVVFLVEAMAMLDQNALKTMRELSPRSPLLSRSEEFRKTVAQFLTGGEETLENQWAAIRSLLGGLLAAIQGGGKDFGRQFVERMSPTAIEDVIGIEGGGKLFGPSKKERCWDRYRDLSEDISTPDLIDRKIKTCLAAFVERTAHSNR